MNKNNLLKLADYLEKVAAYSIHDNGTNEQPVFDLGAWCEDYKPKDKVDGCGTVGCIAGHAVFLFAPEFFRENENISSLAREYIGDVPYNLFVPNSYGSWGFNHVPLYSSVTPKGAAAVVRHLANTGQLDWRVAAPFAPEYVDDDESA